MARFGICVNTNTKKTFAQVEFGKFRKFRKESFK
jgi:hypothetical protein